ncbi:MobF family relaxase [Paraburkholderia sp. C35]|uniref:MobF family relaxase n=1 Tax=Paraburkholderia sp. C35 TaxID=2126993 RepID=UPI000D68A342|nr:MobF family relaxase [Paraburkholderia sp. C35]
MLTVQPLNPKGENKNGMSARQYFEAVEYHRDALTGVMYAPTAWMGKGAEALGLKGTVNFNDFEKLFDGFNPMSGTALTQNAGRDDRRPGWDLTFSMEKSLSVVYADPTTSPEDKERILAIHDAAVELALKHLETLVEVKLGAGGHQRRGDVSLVFSRIRHATSREGDPDVHSHCVLHNIGMTVDPDGTIHWNSIDAAVLKENERGLGAFYRAAVQWGMQQTSDLKIDRVRELDDEGYETGEVYYRIAGVGEFARDKFSKRTEQIEEYMLDNAGVGRQAANLATRKAKDELSFPDQEIAWAKEFEELRDKFPNMYQSRAELSNAKSNMTEPGNQPRSDEEILDACLEMESFFTHGELLRQVSQEYGGIKSPEEIIAHTNQIIASGQVLYYGRDDHQQHRFSTEKMRLAEEAIGKAALARAGDTSVRIDASYLDAALERFVKEKGYRPSEEQLEAARYLACESGGVAVCSGYAGAGKTSGMLLTKMALEDAGKTLLGVSTAWAASNKLAQDVGIESVSSMAIIRDLDNGKLSLTKDHVVVFDEGGMAGMHLAQIQKYVDAAGAKLIVLGDCRQLVPVTASNPMRLIVDAIGDAKLTEIMRQKQQKNRDLAGTWYGLQNADGKPDGQQIMKEMVANDHIRTAENDRDAMRDLVKAYFADERAVEQKLVLGGTRAEVAGLNHQIRAGYKANGLLEGEDHSVRAIVDGKFRNLDLAVNDRIRFSRRNDDLKVVNGDGGVITGITANEDGTGHLLNVRLVSEIEDRNGRELVVDTTEFKSFSYNYAMTTHKSQGQGVDSVYAFIGERGATMVNNNMAMVSYTRHKVDYKMFAADATIHGYVDEHGARHGGLSKQFEEINVKLTTQDVAIVAEKPVFAESEPVDLRSYTERLDDARRNAIDQAREVELQSRQERDADREAMERALRSAIGEHDATKTQVSAFMKNLPAVIERQAQRLAPIEGRGEPIRRFIQDVEEWHAAIEKIDQERGGVQFANQQENEDPAKILRVPDPKDPARPRFATQLPPKAEPTAAVVEVIARAEAEAPPPVVTLEGTVVKHMRATEEWHAAIDQIDRERGGAQFANRQVQEDPALVRRVPDPKDPPRPVIGEWTPGQERTADTTEPVNGARAPRATQAKVDYLHQGKAAESVFDLPQAVGTEVVVHPVRKLPLPVVARVKAEAAPTPAPTTALEKDQKLEGPTLTKPDPNGQGPKPGGPTLKRQRHSM